MNELNRKKNIDNKQYILKENLDSFLINKIFINKFLTGLWNNPEVMYQILNHSDPKDIKEGLAALVVDNFYTNYLSGKVVGMVGDMLILKQDFDFFAVSIKSFIS